MRLGAYVALEVCGLALAAASAAFGLKHIGRFLLTEARGSSRQRIAAISPAHGELPERVRPRIATRTDRTFLGMSDEVLVRRLRTERIVRIKMNRGGTSISLRLDFADGSRAAFKPTQVHPQSVPRKEIAAFRLDRLLGIGHVSPSTARVLTRAELVEKLAEENRKDLPRILAETTFDASNHTAGEAQYFIPAIRDTRLDRGPGLTQQVSWLTALAPPPPPDRAALAEHLSTLAVFDLLTNNSDRYSGGNLVASPDMTFLYFLDNTFGFQSDREGHGKCREALQRVQRFSRSLYDGIKALTPESIRAELAREHDPPFEILTTEEIDALLARRDVAVTHIDSLIARLGRDKVLFFP